jgi:type VI secretion system secreted protein VgrG
MEIATPLGADVLLFHGMHAREELGRLHEYQIDLLSDDGAIDLDAILGKNVTISLLLDDDTTRYFNGVVTRFTQRGKYGRYFRYSAIVRPWLWFLTRTADCRVFQDMTVPDILTAVFADHPTADYELQTTATYRPWTYCVQYRETDFNFVSRLMEHEGIYYYFKHQMGRHTMVLADSYSGHAPAGGYETIPFIPPGQLARPDLEHISQWSLSREVQPGVFVHDDYDAERPSVELKVSKTVARSYAPSDYEVYDYPGAYLKKPDGEQYALVRIEEYAAQFETTHAVTNARGAAVGCLFTLEGHDRADQNREHLIVSSTCDLEFSEYESMPQAGGVDFRCTFTAISSQQPYRSRRLTPKPFVQGPQTAVVVGPDGDEIYTDKYGRVKVQFHWDRRGEKNEESSCWIRVSHPWAGKGWGAVATPRIGQEVIVDFLEGDPDQPIVTGRVYNEEQQPPFGFPAGAVISGVKSDTHKGDGYNEISLDDTAGAEKITIHGQYDMNTVVEHDQTTTVHNNRTDRIDVDDAESVGNNQALDVGVDQTIAIGANRTETVGANETITVSGNRDRTVNGSETVTVMMQRTHTVGINETINVGAAQEITVGGLQAITVGLNQSTNVGVNQSTEVGGNRTVQVDGDHGTTISGNESRAVSKARTTSITEDDALTVGKNLTMTAADSVTIKTGDAVITMKKDGTIDIKGKDITIDGSGKITIKAGGDIVMKGAKILQN